MPIYWSFFKSIVFPATRVDSLFPFNLLLTSSSFSANEINSLSNNSPSSLVSYPPPLVHSLTFSPPGPVISVDIFTNFFFPPVLQWLDSYFSSIHKVQSYNMPSTTLTPPPGTLSIFSPPPNYITPPSPYRVPIMDMAFSCFRIGPPRLCLEVLQSY